MALLQIVAASQLRLVLKGNKYNMPYKNLEINPVQYSEQNTEKFQTVLTIKVDGHPWIVKGGFDRSKMDEIRKEILKIKGVLSFNVNPDNITSL